ncbi:PIN domain-containing protein [Glycomyces albidus]|uniref:PIN domain-containing protein n=1 Tax=Glycomyces albidus TaxID=2656774 RepID=A0A6L5G7R8_9ACTN|nr:PIN domain-containing protein [Glycomyces albidus]MQM25695.1 PIN domain-containing protein [Glycomyces albidus]
MGRKLILDTGVLIGVDRGELRLDSIGYDDDALIASITLSELMVGAILANEARRAERQRMVDFVLETFPVVDFTADTARVHADLSVQARRTGSPRGAHDLMIAATAVMIGAKLVTTDIAARFGDLPGVDCIELKP